MREKLRMMNHDQQQTLATIVHKYAIHEGSNITGIPNVHCLKFSTSNIKIPDIYSPSICIIVQGRKQVLLEDDIYQYSPSEFLAVSVALPLIGQVIEASRDKPYLCLQIVIDPHQMSDLIMQGANRPQANSGSERGIFVGTVNSVVVDAVLRLAKLLETPTDIPILAPLILREIHYRILQGEYGPSIAQLAIPGSNVQKIAWVIQQLRANIAHPIRIADLAESVNMSESSLYYHFKAVTAMSPLQYCKRLRLTEARQIMLSEGADAASTAYRVGYESASQFSREYARMFGASPRKDVAGIKNVPLGH
jgi:AraC-like DNA-binding protein